MSLPTAHDVWFLTRAILTRPGDVPGIIRRGAARKRANLPTSRHLIAESVQGVPERCRRIGRIGLPGSGLGKEVPCSGVQALSVQRPPHGEEEFDILPITDAGNLVKEAERSIVFAKAEKGFTKSYQTVFMAGVQE